MTVQNWRRAGAQVDNAQMLPSPFDNVHGGASAVAHIPSSMQQSAPSEDTKAAGEPSLPHVSHMSYFQQGPHALQLCLMHANISMGGATSSPAAGTVPEMRSLESAQGQ